MYAATSHDQLPYPGQPDHNTRNRSTTSELDASAMQRNAMQPTGTDGFTLPYYYEQNVIPMRSAATLTGSHSTPV